MDLCEIVLDLLGNKQTKIMWWFLQNRTEDNYVFASQRTIAAKTETSRQTVGEAVDFLINKGLMEFISPEVYRLTLP